MKRFNLSGWAVSHPALILFLIVALGAAGFFSYQRLGCRRSVLYGQVVNVSAIWPGATAAEMQTQVADPIEKKLQELPYFEKVQNLFEAVLHRHAGYVSGIRRRQRRCRICFTCCARSWSTCKAASGQSARSRRQRRIQRCRTRSLYMMTSDGADYAQLKKAAEGMRQRLVEGCRASTKVDLYGTQDEKIFVEFSHAKLGTLGITPQALFDSLAKQNNVVPAGTVETSSQRGAAARHRCARWRQGGRRDAVESNGRVFRLAISRP